MADLTKIKDRIAKLLAKANNNSNEHEAQLAMSRARRLMDEHQLDEMDISVAADAEMFGEEMDDVNYAYMPQWRDWLSVAVAKFNDCQAAKVREGADQRRMRLKWRGFKSDVMLAKAMFNYLCGLIDGHTSEYMKTQGYTRYNARVGTGFKEAMTSRLITRMLAMTAERKASERTQGTDAEGRPVGTGLMVYKENQVAEHFGAAQYENVKGKKTEDMEIDELAARLAGDDKGKTAAITNVLEGA